MIFFEIIPFTLIVAYACLELEEDEKMNMHEQIMDIHNDLCEGFNYVPDFIWACPFDVKDLLLEWPCFPIRKNLKKLRKETLFCLI